MELEKTSIFAKANSYTKPFCASAGWLDGFLKRFHLSLRSPTNHITKNGNQACDIRPSLNDKINSFGMHLSSLMSTFQHHALINVDQTPFWWNSSSGTQRTIDQKGTRKVTTRIHPGNPREKVSVILACTQDGYKFPPALVVRKDCQHWKRARIKLIHGVLFFMNPKTSMCNSDIMQRWIRIMMGGVHTTCRDSRVMTDNIHSMTSSISRRTVDIPSSERKNILILDSFRGHLTDEIGVACHDTNTLRAVIPGGLTSQLQPLDLTVNRSFKCKMRDLLRKNILESHETREDRLAVFAKTVQQAWNMVSRDTIQNGFRKMFKAMEECHNK